MPASVKRNPLKRIKQAIRKAKDNPPRQIRWCRSKAANRYTSYRGLRAIVFRTLNGWTYSIYLGKSRRAMYSPSFDFDNLDSALNAAEADLFRFGDV